MNIECLPHEYKRNVFVITIDDEMFKEVHASLFGKSPKFPKTAPSRRAFEEQFSFLEKTCARNFALRRLAKRNYSSFELSKLLKERLVAEDSIAEVIAGIQREGTVNDKDWIDGFIGRGLPKEGPKALYAKLKKKGIPEDLISASLKLRETEFPQGERIRALLESKYRNRDLASFKERQKVIASLMRKGFEFDEIVQALGGD